MKKSTCSIIAVLFILLTACSGHGQKAMKELKWPDVLNENDFNINADNGAIYVGQSSDELFKCIDKSKIEFLDAYRDDELVSSAYEYKIDHTSLIIEIEDDNNGNSVVCRIQVAGGNVGRGIKKGDSEDKVRSLYGVPSTRFSTNTRFSYNKGNSGYSYEYKLQDRILRVYFSHKGKVQSIMYSLDQSESLKH